MSSQIPSLDRRTFENLFVLELANNHWGNLERGLRIVRDFATVARVNSVRTAIKLQFRDVDSFIHPAFKGYTESRYIKKTEATKLSIEEFKALVDEIRRCDCIPMATPFDEASVELCGLFDLPMIKVASSDIATWPLLDRIAHLSKPVIISTGGANDKTIDDCVRFFENRSIPLAINHCVSLYPCEDSELELNQISYLCQRYPNHVIGFSTHEQRDWYSSMLISYAKGARTWERHIDIEADGIPVAPYCSLPNQIDEWYKAFSKAVEMCGGSTEARRTVSERERRYLEELIRGVYACRDLTAGYVFSSETFNNDFYLAIPLHKGQLSCREVINGAKLISDLNSNDRLTIDHVDGPYRENEALRQVIMDRGIEA
ncbi:N-acetylneuraminate synthase family protein [Cyanobium sp. Morenito 9A2]|uniref:N-acetylneuraminate synthase family protein n=1 Tax=Cyanobium sp. Morenito 9A2 TaxID=2823718 RepID=UPI0020CC48AF|nr:N-acetylneuraminate synthase family protein [Cyanobium sp. Morenito 9A2]MCP9848781.1 N-acetylneuraminate synthase family protein [Cyanobium sp. Morenito 9A2]